MSLSLLLRQILVFAVVIGLWIIGDTLNWFNPDVIPPVTDTLNAAIALFGDPKLPQALWLTLRDALAGVMAAALLAIPLGLIIGIAPKVEISTRVLLDFGRAFPAIALVPIFILIIGTNHTTKIVMITIACFFPIIVQTIYGARKIDETMRDTVSSFQIPPLMQFRRVVFPMALPFIATGLRLSLSISILVAVAAEILTQVPGLGTQVSLSRTFNQVPEAFVYTIYAGLMGVILTAAWDVIEKRMLAWHHREDTL
jgi:NitT/TauT family transport system permease protein